MIGPCWPAGQSSQENGWLQVQWEPLSQGSKVENDREHLTLGSQISERAHMHMYTPHKNKEDVHWAETNAKLKQS